MFKQTVAGEQIMPHPPVYLQEIYQCSTPNSSTIVNARIRSIPNPHYSDIRAIASIITSNSNVYIYIHDANDPDAPFSFSISSQQEHSYTISWSSSGRYLLLIGQHSATQNAIWIFSNKHTHKFAFLSQEFLSEISNDTGEAAHDLIPLPDLDGFLLIFQNSNIALIKLIDAENVATPHISSSVILRTKDWHFKIQASTFHEGSSVLALAGYNSDNMPSISLWKFTSEPELLDYFVMDVNAHKLRFSLDGQILAILQEKSILFRMIERCTNIPWHFSVKRIRDLAYVNNETFLVLDDNTLRCFEFVSRPEERILMMDATLPQLPSLNLVTMPGNEGIIVSYVNRLTSEVMVLQLHPSLMSIIKASLLSQATQKSMSILRNSNGTHSELEECSKLIWETFSERYTHAHMGTTRILKSSKREEDIQNTFFAIEALNTIQHDPSYVFHQSIHTVFTDSIDNQRSLLRIGNQNEYLRRLDTLEKMCAEVKHATIAYSGELFVQFRDAPLNEFAQILMCENEKLALSILHDRHSDELLPYEVQIAACAPLTWIPRAIRGDSDDAIRYVIESDKCFGQLPHALDRCKAIEDKDESLLQLQLSIEELSVLVRLGSVFSELTIEQYMVLPSSERIWRLYENLNKPDVFVSAFHSVFKESASDTSVADFCARLLTDSKEITQSIALIAEILNHVPPLIKAFNMRIVCATRVFERIFAPDMSVPKERSNIIRKALWKIVQSLVQDTKDVKMESKVSLLERFLLALDRLEPYEISLSFCEISAAPDKMHVQKRIQRMLRCDITWDSIWEDVMTLHGLLYSGETLQRMRCVALEVFLFHLLTNAPASVQALFQRFLAMDSTQSLRVLAIRVAQRLSANQEASVSLDVLEKNVCECNAADIQFVSQMKTERALMRIAQIVDDRVWLTRMKEAIQSHVFEEDRMKLLLALLESTPSQYKNMQSLESIAIISSVEYRLCIRIRSAYCAIALSAPVDAFQIAQDSLSIASEGHPSVQLFLLIVDLFSLSDFSHFQQKYALFRASIKYILQFDPSLPFTSIYIGHSQQIQAIQSLLLLLDVSETEIAFHNVANSQPIEKTLLGEILRALDHASDPQHIISLLQSGLQFLHIFPQNDSMRHCFLRKLCVLQSKHDPDTRFVIGTFHAYAETSKDISQLWTESLGPSLLSSEEGDIIRYECIFKALLSLFPAQTNDFAAILTQCEHHRAGQRITDALQRLVVACGEDLDTQKFTEDASYRTRILQHLSRDRATYPVAVEFAEQYAMDTYDVCLLSYMEHALLSSSPSPQTLASHFRPHFLEEALEQPQRLAVFLLGPYESTTSLGIYAKLNGKDYVALLFLFRVLLECSKRVQAEESQTRWLPLSAAAKQRLTILFMCLKRLLNAPNETRVDFKLFSQCQTAHALLSGAKREFGAKNAALQVVTTENVRILSKIAHLLYQIRPSAFLLLYSDEICRRLRETQQIDANAAAYAYDACAPFFSVLTNEDLLRFYKAFAAEIEPGNASIEPIERKLEALSELNSMGRALSIQKRLEVQSDVLGLLRSKGSDSATSEQQRMVLNDVYYSTLGLVSPSGAKLIAEYGINAIERTEFQQVLESFQDIHILFLFFELLELLWPAQLHSTSLMQRFVQDTVQSAFTCAHQAPKDVQHVLSQWSHSIASSERCFPSLSVPKAYAKHFKSLTVPITKSSCVSTVLEVISAVRVPELRALHDTKRHEVTLSCAVRNSLSRLEIGTPLEWFVGALFTQTLSQRNYGSNAPSLKDIRISFMIKALFSRTDERYMQMLRDITAARIARDFNDIARNLTEICTQCANAELTSTLLQTSRFCEDVSGDNDTCWTWSHEKALAIVVRLQKTLGENVKQRDTDVLSSSYHNDIFLLDVKLLKPAHFLAWYKNVAFPHVSVESIAAFVSKCGNEELLMAAEILLRCPANSLRGSMKSVIIEALRAMDSASAELFELLLLRLDVNDLLWYRNAHMSIYERLQNMGDEMGPTTVCGTLGYYINALEACGEDSIAARLVCRLYGVHPALYAHESSQWMLYRFIKDIIEALPGTSEVEMLLRAICEKNIEKVTERVSQHGMI